MIQPVPITDDDSGVTYMPWSNGHALGWEAHHVDGHREFIYMNPSQGSDDGVPTVFVYQGTTGDPCIDPAITHFVIK